jgi:hypothetical protein
MNLSGAQSEKITTLLKGAAIGFVVLAVGGQFWPGYMLDSNAKIASDEATAAANNVAASLLCQHLYMGASDGAAKLVTLRATDSYRIGNDADIAAAATQAIKLFTEAKVSPEPNSYRVKTECGEQLHKRPVAAAQAK